MRNTAYERLEAAIGLLKDWQGNDDITAPIERICEVVEAFDAWKVAREADPPDPDRERTPAPLTPDADERAMAERWARMRFHVRNPGGDFDNLGTVAAGREVVAMLPLVREAAADRDKWRWLAEVAGTAIEQLTSTTPVALTEAEAQRWFDLEYNAWQRDEDDKRSVRMLAAGIICRASRGDIPADVLSAGRCGKIAPDGYPGAGNPCTLPAGHASGHEARSADGRLLAVSLPPAPGDIPDAVRAVGTVEARMRAAGMPTSGDIAVPNMGVVSAPDPTLVLLRKVQDGAALSREDEARLCTEGLAELIETYPPTLELTLRGKRMLRGEIPTPAPKGGA